MSTYDFYNEVGGEIAIGTVTTEIAAYLRKGSVLGVQLVGQASNDVVDLIRRSLVDHVSSLSSEPMEEVESHVRVLIKVDAYSAPRADGSRVRGPAWDELSVDASREEVAAASEAASKVALTQMEAAVLRQDRDPRRL